MRGRQSGQTLIMFAIAMTFVFTAMIALVGDADTLMVRYNQVNAEALLRAQAGASAIDTAAVYRGQHALDPALAVQRCEQAGIAGGGGHPRQVTCTFVPPNRVTATVSEDVTLPIPLFMTTATVRATRTGQAVFGDQHIVGS
ncbi:MAG TPA: hypothetical protein VFD49_15170 [Candidatus Dormibacteraeota bacterium]|nr:hypothetical protein [Candidatus Dormibacteraeota bacterium]